VLEQDLEAHHRVARPGVVADGDQVGRRAVGDAEPTPGLGRQEILDGVRLARLDPEDLPRRPEQVADRERRPA